MGTLAAIPMILPCYSALLFCPAILPCFSAPLLKPHRSALQIHPLIWASNSILQFCPTILPHSSAPHIQLSCPAILPCKLNQLFCSTILPYNSAPFCLQFWATILPAFLGLSIMGIVLQLWSFLLVSCRPRQPRQPRQLRQVGWYYHKSFTQKTLPNVQEPLQWKKVYHIRLLLGLRWNILRLPSFIRRPRCLCCLFCKKNFIPQ